MHDHFRVGLPHQVRVRIGQQLVAELGVVGQLPVEGKTEPLVLFDVRSLERLGVVAVIGAAGGISDVPDCRRAPVLPHEAVVLAAVVQTEDFGHASHVLIGIKDLSSSGLIRAHPGCQLSPVLDVEEHPRHKSHDFCRLPVGAKRTRSTAGKVIDRRYPAFFVHITHGRLRSYSPTLSHDRSVLSSLRRRGPPTNSRRLESPPQPAIVGRDRVGVTQAGGSAALKRTSGSREKTVLYPLPRSRRDFTAANSLFLLSTNL